MPTSTAYLYPNEVTIDSSAWVLTGAPTKWEAIDDPVGLPDDDTSYLECVTTIAGVEQISFGFQPMPEAVSIVSVTVEIRSKKTTGSGNHQTFINGGGGAGHTLDVVYTDYDDVFTTDPLTGLDWSKAGVDAAAVTIVQDATAMTARLTAMRLKVVFVASAAKIGAAREVGSRIVRAFRRPVGQVALRGPLLWADVELLTDFTLSHFSYPHAQGLGARDKPWQRALLRCISTSIDLDTMEVSIVGLDLRQYVVRFWDTGISEEPANATSPGAARLDPGTGRGYTRSTKAYVLNAAAAAQGAQQIIPIGADIEKAEPLGMLIEPARRNDLLNSSFVNTLATNWTVTGNVVADTTVLLFDPAVTPRTAKFARSGSSACNLAQASPSYVGTEVLAFSCRHLDDSGAALTWSGQRSTDGFWWNDSTEVWQAGFVANAFTVRAVFELDQSNPIILNAIAQSVTFTIYAESVADQVNHLAHAQLEVGSYATSAIVTEGAAVTRAADVLRIQNDLADQAVWWNPQATVGLNFRPLWDSSDGDLPDVTLLDVVDDGDSNRWMRITYSPAIEQARYELRTGGVTYAATLDLPLVRGQNYRFVGRRTGSNLELDLAENTLSIFVDGVRGTDDVAATSGVGGDWMYIGSQQGVENWAGGHITHVTSTPVVLADEEIPDWL